MHEQVELFNAFFAAGDLVVVATITGFLFLLGACAASFSCLVAFRLARLPEDRPLIAAISTPPSSCDHCGRRLSMLDLVPVLGWLAARGTCRDCGGNVPARYPALEAAMGLVCAAAPFVFGGLTAQCFAAVFVACAAFLAAAIDWENGLVPEEVTWTLLFSGLLASPFVTDVWSRAAGAALGAVLVWLSMALIGWWKRIDTRAVGDVAMGAAGGAWLGLQPVSWWLFAACFVHVAICALAASEDEEGMTWLPFGPALMGVLPVALAVSPWIATPG
jgi:leader peptidase (prepilin peptidase)/N-methyltransferase